MDTIKIIQSTIRSFLYQITGPTTVHLRFELSLLVALYLMTLSSLQGLYKHSFGIAGDYIYLSLLFICLARHSLLRLLCTWDPSTHACPTVQGFLSHFVTAHLTAGQVFDRPHRHLIARFIGINHVDEMESISWRNVLPSFAIYAWNLFRIRIMLPLQEYRRRRRRRRRLELGRIHPSYNFGISRGYSTTKLESNHRIRRTLASTTRTAYSLWIAWAPSLQSTITFTALVLVLVGLNNYYMRYLSRSTTHLSYSTDNIEWSVLALDTRGRSTSHTDPNDFKPRGAYRRRIKPTWSETFGIMFIIGEACALISFLRLVNPLPDLVAGANVIRDIKKDATQRSNPSSGSTRSTAKTSRGGRDNTNLTPQPNETAWAERVRSIATMKRVRLHLWVIAIRVLENVLLCGIIPRTLFICRVTGHCSTAMSAWELSRIIFPAGVSTPYREDGVTWFSHMEWDIPSAFWTIFGIVTVTFLLLGAHALVSNKDYLALFGYLACQWQSVDPEELQQLPPSASPSPWDPRKKYKEGDLVSYAISGKKTFVYRATIDHPQCNPLGQFLLHDWLQSELGHPSTSRLLIIMVNIQTWITGGYSVLWLLLTVLGRGRHGLFTFVLANAVALHALMVAGETKSGVLIGLSDEMKAYYESS